MTAYRSWGTLAWIASFNPSGRDLGRDPGSYVVGGILLALTVFGLVRLAAGLVAHRRLVKRLL